MSQIPKRALLKSYNRATKPKKNPNLTKLIVEENDSTFSTVEKDALRDREKEETSVVQKLNLASAPISPIRNDAVYNKLLLEDREALYNQFLTIKVVQPDFKASLERYISMNSERIPSREFSCTTSEDDLMIKGTKI